MGKIGRMASAGFRAVGGMDTLKSAGSSGLSALMGGGMGALGAAGGAGMGSAGAARGAGFSGGDVRSRVHLGGLGGSAPGGTPRTKGVGRGFDVDAALKSIEAAGRPAKAAASTVFSSASDGQARSLGAGFDPDPALQREVLLRLGVQPLAERRVEDPGSRFALLVEALDEIDDPAVRDAAVGFLLADPQIVDPDGSLRDRFELTGSQDRLEFSAPVALARLARGAGRRAHRRRRPPGLVKAAAMVFESAADGRARSLGEGFDPDPRLQRRVLRKLGIESQAHEDRRIEDRYDELSKALDAIEGPRTWNTLVGFLVAEPDKVDPDGSLRRLHDLDG
jgi:hypothetical protein